MSRLIILCLLTLTSVLLYVQNLNASLLLHYLKCEKSNHFTSQINDRALLNIVSATGESEKISINSEGCMEKGYVFSLLNADSIISVYWNFGDAGSGVANNSAQPSPSHKFSIPGQYLVSVNIIYSSALTETITQLVMVVKCQSKITFPSVFTPNGDKNNDVFLPQGSNISSYNLQVFNRWGSKMFETEFFSEGWDGTSEGKLCPAGTYYFVAEYSLSTDGIVTEETINGNVMLIR